jgi:putative porin
MLGKKLIFIVAIASFLFSATATYSQDANALLDLLVRKKLITAKEAEEVRAEMKQSKPKAEASSSSASNSSTTSTVFTEAKKTPILSMVDKWKLSTPITELELYGDARLRYEYRGGQTIDTPTSHDDWQERKRERYRLRLGLRGTLADDWFFGIRLETGQAPRSTNVTFGDDTSTTSGGGGGPFAKGSDGINVGQAYFGYKGFKDLTLTGGKMPNPLVTTWMAWDPDINPEGAAEQWKHTFKFGGGGEAAAQSYSKDGKDVAATKSADESYKLDVFANFGQFVYDDLNPEDPLGPPAVSNGDRTPTNDAWLLAWQVGARFTFPNTLYAQLAPTFYNHTGNGDTFNTHFQGGDPTLTNTASLAQNQTGINSLLVFDMPAEVGWKVGKLPMRVFGDFAVNFEGDDRALAAGHSGKGDQRYSYVIGVGAGQLKKKYDWQVDVFWQHSEQYSLDPNLIDNDAFDARLNIEGVGVRAGFMLSDAVFFNVTYTYGWRIDDALGTGGANDIAINPLDQYQLLQADLNVKF